MTSVDGVVADLKIVECELKAAHEAVITALESGGRLSNVESLERTVQEITAKRDDLIGTKTFIIGRERQRAERDNKKLSTAQYISQWDSSLQVEEISAFALSAHHRNESIGITGALYVFRGWFASYLEGEDAVLDATLNKVARDSRHTGFAILKRERGLPASTPRKIPEVGLKLQWVNDESKTASKYEAFMIASLCQQLSLTGYVPRSVLTQAQQLSQRKESNCATDEVGQTLLGREASTSDCPLQQQYVVSIAPCSDAFWDGTARGFGDDPTAVVPQCLEAVVTIAKKVWERPTEDSFFTAVGGDFGSTAPGQQLGSILGPHGAERLLVASGRFVDEALHRCCQFLKTFQQLYPVEYSCYQPTLALHTGEIQCPVNERLTIVGPMLRTLQQLSLVAKQEGIPIAVGFRVADEANRRGVQSFGHFLFEGTPDEVFVPTEFPNALWNVKSESSLSDTANQISLAGTVVRALPDAPAPTMDEGGVPQQLPTHKNLRTSKPAPSDTTIDELNVAPPRGFVQESEIRLAFDSLFPNPEDDTIAMETYSAYYQGFDHMGVTEQIGEMEGKMSAFQPGRERMANVQVSSGEGQGKLIPAHGGANAAAANRRVTFDQFAMMYYRRLQ